MSTAPTTSRASQAPEPEDTGVMCGTLQTPGNLACRPKGPSGAAPARGSAGGRRGSVRSDLGWTAPAGRVLENDRCLRVATDCAIGITLRANKVTLGGGYPG